MHNDELKQKKVDKIGNQKHNFKIKLGKKRILSVNVEISLDTTNAKEKQINEPKNAIKAEMIEQNNRDNQMNLIAQENLIKKIKIENRSLRHKIVENKMEDEYSPNFHQDTRNHRSIQNMNQNIQDRQSQVNISQWKYIYSIISLPSVESEPLINKQEQSESSSVAECSLVGLDLHLFSQFIDLSHIKQLSQHKVSHLHSISLGENLLNDESLELLTSLKFDNLRYLYLWKNQIRDIRCLGRLRLLESEFRELSVSWNELDEVSAEFLARQRFAKLQKLDVSFKVGRNDELLRIMAGNRLRNYENLERLKIYEEQQISKETKLYIQSLIKSKNTAKLEQGLGITQKRRNKDIPDPTSLIWLGSLADYQNQAVMNTDKFQLEKQELQKEILLRKNKKIRKKTKDILKGLMKRRKEHNVKVQSKGDFEGFGQRPFGKSDKQMKKEVIYEEFQLGDSDEQQNTQKNCKTHHLQSYDMPSPSVLDFDQHCPVSESALFQQPFYAIFSQSQRHSQPQYICLDSSLQQGQMKYF